MTMPDRLHLVERPTPLTGVDCFSETDPHPLPPPGEEGGGDVFLRGTELAMTPLPPVQFRVRAGERSPVSAGARKTVGVATRDETRQLRC